MSTSRVRMVSARSTTARNSASEAASADGEQIGLAGEQRRAALVDPLLLLAGGGELFFELIVLLLSFDRPV